MGGMRRVLLFLVPFGILMAAAGFGGGWVLARWPADILSTGQGSSAPTTSAMPTPLPTATATDTATATASPTLTATDTTTPAYTASETSTPTITLTPSRTPSPTAMPEIRGRVMEQANCRYGPGAAYLYEWGMYPGNRVTVLGRNQDGSWVYVDPWNFTGECWVKTSILKILSGSVMDVREFYGLLPFTELYKPPRAVSARRVGDEVTVIWEPVWMTQDDYWGYLIEAWLCVNRQLIFTPVSIDGTVIILHDEAGCQQPSSARIYTADKHGYTEWRLIHWPPNTGPVPTVTPEP